MVQYAFWDFAFDFVRSVGDILIRSILNLQIALGIMDISVIISSSSL